MNTIAERAGDWTSGSVRVLTREIEVEVEIKTDETEERKGRAGGSIFNQPSKGPGGKEKPTGGRNPGRAGSMPTGQGAGRGGQFAKGGGRVPGRAGNFASKDTAPRVSATSGAGIVEVDGPSLDRMQAEIRDANSDPSVLRQRLKDQAGKGAFADRDVVQAHLTYVSNSGSHAGMNEAARRGATAGTDARRVAALDRGFKPPPAQPLPEGPVFRGVNRDQLGPTLKPGDRFVDDGFVSVSGSGRTALSFSQQLGNPATTEHRTVYRITPKSKAPVVAGNLVESEWILPRGSVFTVGAITQFTNQNGSVQRIIDLEWDGPE